MDDDRKYIREFLFKAIDDNQALIRSLDTKAALGLAVLGAMIAQIVRMNWVTLLINGTMGLKLVSLWFSCLVGLGAIVAFRIIFPSINPVDNVGIVHELTPPFFIADLVRCGILRFVIGASNHARLAPTHKQFVHQLSEASVADVEMVLAAEVLKLSFIRQLKTERLAAFSRTLILAIFTFIVIFAMLGGVSATEKQTPPSTKDTNPACSAVTTVFNCEKSSSRR